MTAIVSSETPARHSPCVGMCRLDDASAVCIGCGRSRDEIANWISMSESERDGVWSLLPGRLSKLSVGIRLLPWTAPELLHWAADTIDQRRGTWVTGVPGAVGEFACGTEGPLSVALTKNVVAARMGDAEFRLRVSDKLRAFAVADDGPIVLGLPRSRATRQPATAFTCLGKDVDAIDPANRNGYLF